MTATTIALGPSLMSEVEHQSALRRAVIASTVGTTIEWYDFLIYSTVTGLVFNKVYFPGSDPWVGTLQAFGVYFVGFVARPIGAAIFGHYGDRIGRKATLIVTLLMTGIATAAVGLVPGYDSIGIWGAVILVVLRLIQGIGVGGEWGGSVLLAMEWAQTNKNRGFITSWPQFGAPVGLFLANVAVLFFSWYSGDQFLEWGWRIPFLASALLVGLGLWVRLKLTETPVFAAALAEAPPPRVPLVEVLRDYPRQAIGGTFAVVACFAIFYLATAFALGYGTTKLGYARATFLELQLGAILFLGLGIVTAGYLADRFNPRIVLMSGCAGTVVVGFLLAPMLGSGSLLLIFLFLSLALFLMGLAYGPLGAWLPGLFPARVRYTGASMAFNVGGILGGALAPILALQLADMGGLLYVGLYLGAAAMISLIALAPLRSSAAVV